MRIASWCVVVGIAILGCSLIGRDGWLIAHAREAPAASAAADSTPAPEPNSARHFDEQIAPLLARHCLECHDSSTRKGKLDLSRKQTAYTGGKKKKVIVPGKSAESLLWEMVESDEMPSDDRPPLSPEEKRLLREWIDGGAVWSAADEIDPLAHMRDRRVAQNWLRRLTVPEYIETVRSAVGVEIEEDARRILPADLRADGFSNTAYNLTVDLGHIEAYARLAEMIVGRMDVEKFAQQYSKRQDLKDDAMRELIASMGKWLLRGPLEEHEINAFLGISKAVAKDGGKYPDAVGFIIEAMLQSPRFVYRIETQNGKGEGRRVNDYELASRLSYIIWGGPPDKELMRAADAGELSDGARLESQVRRMLDDPRAVQRSEQFIHEWLNLERLANMRPNQERFPNWNEQLATDMREETLAFFRHIAWEEKRPLADLLNADVTFVTPRLADHYGLTKSTAPAEPERKPTIASAPRRITGGLQVLYTFEKDGGETIRDVSGNDNPVHLKIADKSAVKWSKQGLAVNKPTLIASDGAPRKLIDRLRETNALTLEAWVTPANASQSGPARVLTLSENTGARNFTLGQSGDRFEVRLRTSETSGNGEPSLSSASGTAGTSPVHVAYTRSPSGDAIVYVNGKESERRKVGGKFANWESGFRLALANELSKDRPWQGTLHLIALYDRALSAEEVRQNQSAGPRQDGKPGVASAPPARERSRAGLEALYQFDERKGDTVRDASGKGEALNLKIADASAVKWEDGGLTVKGSTLIATPKSPKRLIDAIKKSKAITIEAWVTPENTKQSGPARIVTLSSGISQRNVTLGQDGDKYEVRLRAGQTDANGLPGTSTPGDTVETRATHIAYTRDAKGKVKLYVDGEEKESRDVGGDLSKWADNYQLTLANESTKDRPWRGTFHRVAIYSRALTPDEIRSGGPQDQTIARYDLASIPARGGLLTQGSVLTVGGDEASMVTRGLFVLKDLLYSGVGNPPPGTDTTPIPPQPGMSHRAIAESRLANDACAGCHSKFEPLAFGLEKFDGIGAFHEKDEHGNQLREDGEVLFPGTGKSVRYDTIAELMNLLAQSDRVRMNITRKVTQFALGRPLVASDDPVLDKIHKSAQDGGGTYQSLITAIVMSDLVQLAQTETSP